MIKQKINKAEQSEFPEKKWKINSSPWLEKYRLLSKIKFSF